MSLLAQAITGKKNGVIATDAVMDPFWEQTNEMAKESGSARFGSMQPAQELLTIQQKRAAWINSPKGYFVIDVAVKDIDGTVTSSGAFSWYVQKL